jgi:hypothetical protein
MRGAEISMRLLVSADLLLLVIFIGIGIWCRAMIGAAFGALIVIPIFHFLTLEFIVGKVGANGSVLDKLEKWINKFGS